ncbi:hypothetical protein IWQ62_003477 [Dispira parvispora]|uniref:Signal peptidase complex subunit 2 n=1 Tax=Dispira parvispora TaxID=1520584 RepID=A0A9W8E6H8_9FUNG|nr:hypothetical protein IWQ62_003477 [Dispira parvispora]
MAELTTTTSPPVTATKYNLKEMEVLCSEALEKYFGQQRGYKQHHTHTDVKLVLGYTACALAAFDFVYTWKKPFEETCWSTLLCVVGFVIFSSLASLYTYLVEKDTIFVGSKVLEDQKFVLSVSSRTKPGDEHYYLTLSLRPLQNQSQAPVPTHSFSQSLGKWFHESGQLDMAAIEHDLGRYLDEVEAKKQG